MKTKLFFIVGCIASIKAATAQDLLVTNDSVRLQTEVLEIQTNTIKYNLTKNNGGPSYIVGRSSIAYIVFKNGTSERFTKKPEVDFSVYNLDGSKSNSYHDNYRIPRHNKDNEHLYKRKNYLGMNHLALLNSNLSFTYMRDIRKEKFILQIPVSIGIGKPDITNSVYGGIYLNPAAKNTYNLMNYQVGAGLLFTPSFGERVNFLIGPSFSFAQYNMSTKAVFGYTDSNNASQLIYEEFKNNFVMFRQQYGGTIGFLFRISEKINMIATANIGGKKDSYLENDPFGIEYMNKKTVYQREAPQNVRPFANFAWSIGYRF
jgi:hypothetical protein